MWRLSKWGTSTKFGPLRGCVFRFAVVFSAENQQHPTMLGKVLSHL
jgi:hypothetical protein